MVDSPVALADALDTLLSGELSPAWRTNLVKLSVWLDGMMVDPAPFSIFVKGNGKLPFWAFSSLPGTDCPGAGACLAWCYSFKAWRYPAAFCRQLQNALLLRHAPEHVAAAWERVPRGTVVRLYVDGDIATPHILRFWMWACASRSDLRVYGYSKSWALFLGYAAQGLPWPANYMLNLSSGSKYDDTARAAMLALPITRGTFTAVSVASHANYAEGGEAEHKAHLDDLRTAGRTLLGTAKVFACPGRCGDCLPRGEHACGSDRMRNVHVVIATH